MSKKITLPGIIILSFLLRIIIFIQTENYFINWEDVPSAPIVLAKLFTFSQFKNCDLPLHPFLIKFSLLLYNNTLFSPRLLSLIFGSLLIIPFFYLIQTSFNKKIAVYSSLILAFYPVQIIQSVISTDMALFHFLFLWAIFFIQEYIHRNKLSYLFLSALFLNAAHMTRMESWLLSPLLILYLLYRKKLAAAIILLVLGNIFIPLDLLFNKPLTYISEQTYEAKFEISILLQENRLPAFGPFSILYWIKVLFISLNTPLIILGILGLGVSLLRKKNILFMLIFFTLFTAYTYKFLTKTVQPHPRYSILMGIFLIPFIFYFLDTIIKPEKWKKHIIILLTIFSLIHLSCKKINFYGEEIPSMLTTIKNPRKQPALTKELLRWITYNVKKNETLFLDQPQHGIVFLNLIAYSHLDMNNILYLQDRPFSNEDEFLRIKSHLFSLFIKQKPKYLILFNDGGFYYLFKNFKDSEKIDELQYQKIFSKTYNRIAKKSYTIYQQISP